MEYITSRGFKLPTNADKMENSKWFHLWKRKYFPYSELLIGDYIYWFDTNLQQLVWKTKVVDVNRFQYSNKQVVYDRYSDSSDLKYIEEKPDTGFFISYKVEVLEKLNIDKPPKFRFPQLGWLRIDDKIALNWFNKRMPEDTTKLDDIVANSEKPIAETFAEINEKMKYVSPERCRKVISSTIRKDTKIIKILKKIADFKCQFPNCGKRIIKKGGDFYIEVAHIKPVSQGGKSILGNLIVLCPNHHKEFDFGDLEISEQTDFKLVGILNGKNFVIDLNNSV